MCSMLSILYQEIYIFEDLEDCKVLPFRNVKIFIS